MADEWTVTGLVYEAAAGRMPAKHAAELAELLVATARNEGRKFAEAARGRSFPLQKARRDYPRAAAPLRIPWSVAEKAYGVYASKYGREQSLERLAERGGFGVEEMDVLYPPWRDEVDEILALRAALAGCERQYQAKVAEFVAEMDRREAAERSREEWMARCQQKSDDKAAALQALAAAERRAEEAERQRDNARTSERAAQMAEAGAVRRAEEAEREVRNLRESCRIAADAHRKEGDRAASLSARVEALEGALRGLPCMYVWRAALEGKVARDCQTVYEAAPDMPEHAWCPMCRARAALAAPAASPDDATHSSKNEE